MLACSRTSWRSKMANVGFLYSLFLFLFLLFTLSLWLVCTIAAPLLNLLSQLEGAAWENLGYKWNLKGELAIVQSDDRLVSRSVRLECPPPAHLESPMVSRDRRCRRGTSPPTLVRPRARAYLIAGSCSDVASSALRPKVDRR